MALTKKEAKLLYYLDKDYRKSYSQIGKKIRMSEQLISHKVKTLLKKGVIKGYLPLIDYSRLGLLSFIVFFKVHYQNEENFNKFIGRLKEHENITSIFECDGKYDLALVFIARNPSSFNKKLRKLIAENKELKQRMILTTVVEHHYFRNYLVNKEGEDDIIIGGDREEVKLDDLNKNILADLVEGKKKIIEIANAEDITPKTAVLRLRSLEEQEILRAYRLILSQRMMGVSTNLILIRYHDIILEQDEKFRYFCRSNQNIVWFMRVFGEWDIILQVETKNRAEFRKLFLRIRESFDEMIEDIDTFRIFSVHKKQFLPAEVIKQKAAVSEKRE